MPRIHQMSAVTVIVQFSSYAGYWYLIFFKDSGICSISETKEINILPLIGKKRIKQYLFCHSKISVFQTVICDQLVGHKISLSHDQHLT